MANYQRWCLLRRIYSKRQVLEVVTEFFENHLHVPVQDDGVFGFRGGVRQAHPLPRPGTVRPDARRGRHPPRDGDQPGQRHLDQDRAQREPRPGAARAAHRGPRQLHRGRRQELRPDPDRLPRRHVEDVGEAWYEPASHWTGPVKVLDFTHRTPPRTAVRSPRPTSPTWPTTRRPPSGSRASWRSGSSRTHRRRRSSTHLADVYLANQTAIVPVLQALVAHPEFAASAGAKVRTPTDDVVATYRALDVAVRRPAAGDSTAQRDALAGRGDRARPRSGGPGRTDSPRRAPPGRPRRGSWPRSTCTSRWPAGGGPTRTPPTTRSPSGSRSRAGQSMRSRRWSSTCPVGSCAVPRVPACVDACCLATGLTAATSITTSHALVRWGMPVLLTTVLDSPEHMSR